MNFSIAQESRIGGRDINQDRAAWAQTSDALIMLVADGMGGHLQGEVAAQIASDTIIELFRQEARPRLTHPADFLDRALHTAHANLVNYAQACRIPLHAAPRTTCIACILQDGIACWAHAGDSRLYLIHRQGPSAHTRDHSVVQRLVDQGQLKPEEMARHPLRNRVFSCLGGDLPPRIEHSGSIPLQDDDIIALCSDGAWSPLNDRIVAELGRSALTVTVPRLLDAAETVAGPDADNLTLIALRWNEPDTETATISEAWPWQSPPAPPLSDEDIDHAIDDIRRRLARTAQKGTPHESNR